MIFQPFWEFFAVLWVTGSAAMGAGEAIHETAIPAQRTSPVHNQEGN